MKWQEYSYEEKKDKKANTADGDADYKPGNSKKTELVVKDFEDTVIAFLDAFEKAAAKHVRHRSILARQREAAAEFDRERRPGVLSADIDFGGLWQTTTVFLLCLVLCLFLTAWSERQFCASPLP